MRRLLHAIGHAPGRALDWLGEYDVNAEKRIVVNGHDGLVPVYWMMAFRLVVAWGALFLMTNTPENSPLNTLGFITVAMIMGAWAGKTLRRAGAYRHGWIDGRMRIVTNLKQHDNFEDWLDAEGNHDMVHVMGMPPMPHPNDPNHPGRNSG